MYGPLHDVPVEPGVVLDHHLCSVDEALAGRRLLAVLLAVEPGELAADLAVLAVREFGVAQFLGYHGDVYRILVAICFPVGHWPVAHGDVGEEVLELHDEALVLLPVRVEHLHGIHVGVDVGDHGLPLLSLDVLLELVELEVLPAPLAEQVLFR